MNDNGDWAKRDQAERDRIALQNYERELSDIDERLKQEADTEAAEQTNRRTSKVRRLGRRVADWVLSPRILWLTIRDARDSQDEE